MKSQWKAKFKMSFAGVKRENEITEKNNILLMVVIPLKNCKSIILEYTLNFSSIYALGALY